MKVSSYSEFVPINSMTTRRLFVRIISQQKYFKLLNNPHGNMAVIVLCLMATSMAAFQISLSHSGSVKQEVKNSRILSARDALQLHIKTYSTLGTTFRSSMHPSLPVTVNSELRNCILGTGPIECKAGVITPVALYYPMSSTTITPSTPLQRISGPGDVSITAAESATYDNKGNLCAVTATGIVDPNCPFFEVTTTFIATCAGGLPSCATAEFLSVSYVIKLATALAGASSSVALHNFPLATIKLSAPAISRANILPPLAGASDNNITISLLPSSTTTTTTTLGLEDIKAAIMALGKTNPDRIDAMALAFQQSGINDLSKLDFLVQVAISDPAWMLLVTNSGITNVFLASEMYYINNPWTSENLAATVAAVAGLPDGPIKYAIARQMVTDSTVVAQIVASVSSVSNPYIASGLILGGFNTDPVKTQAIVAGVSQVADPILAGYLARIGITDQALATQLASIVSAIPTSWDAGGAILAGNGDPVTTQNIVNNYLLTGSFPSTSTSTTFVSTLPPPPTISTSPTPALVEISLMPTCLTCPPVSY